jgi:transglutaminase-like putative cysteine protease
MRTAEYRFLLALVVPGIFARSVAADDLEKHFEGPYKITITASKKIRATVTSVYHYPNMTAREWWVAYPLPPQFDGQPAVRGSFRILEAPAAQPGRISDESPLRQPLETLHWFPDTVHGGQGFTVEATYDVTVNRRKLEPGEPSAPVVPLKRAERAACLAPSNHFDFTSSKFRAWLAKYDLKRQKEERDLDFAYRAMQTMVETHVYRFELKSDRSATAVCKAGWSDCGGLATVYVSILRANGIPARCLSGRNFKPNGTHVRLEFYADGVGWVPGDPSVAIARHTAQAGFGRESTDMVIMHFDLIRLERQYHWLQGIGAVRSINHNEEGNAAGMSLEHSMTVEILADSNAPASAGSDLGESRKRQTGPVGRRSE